MHQLRSEAEARRRRLVQQGEAAARQAVEQAEAARRRVEREREERIASERRQEENRSELIAALRVYKTAVAVSPGPAHPRGGRDSATEEEQGRASPSLIEEQGYQHQRKLSRGFKTRRTIHAQLGTSAAVPPRSPGGRPPSAIRLALPVPRLASAVTRSEIKWRASCRVPEPEPLGDVKGAI